MRTGYCQLPLVWAIVLATTISLLHAQDELLSQAPEVEQRPLDVFEEVA